MALLDIDDVRDHLPQIDIDDNSRPTEEAVVEWIDEVESATYAMLQNLTPKATTAGIGVRSGCIVTYVLPIDPDASPIAAGLLKDMMLHAITARILRARLYGIGDASQGGAREAQQYYDQRIAWLADPRHPFALTDAVVSTEVCPPSWFSNIKAFGDTEGEGYRPRPTMRTQF